MSVCDDVTNAHEVIEQLAELTRAVGDRPGGVELADRLLQGLAPHEPHGVERAAVAGLSQGINRHNAGVLQSTSDFGLEQETGLALGVAGLRLLDQLEGDLAVQPAVASHEHLAQAPARQRPQDLEVLIIGRNPVESDRPLGSIGWFRAELRGRFARVPIAIAGQRRGPGERVRLGDRRLGRVWRLHGALEHFAQGLERIAAGERLQAAPGIALRECEVMLDRLLDQSSRRLIEHALIDQDLSRRSTSAGGPARQRA